MSTHLRPKIFPFLTAYTKAFWQDAIAEFLAEIRASVRRDLWHSITDSNIEKLQGEVSALQENFYKDTPDQGDRWIINRASHGRLNPLYIAYRKKHQKYKDYTWDSFILMDTSPIKDLTPQQRWRYHKAASIEADRSVLSDVVFIVGALALVASLATLGIGGVIWVGPSLFVMAMGSACRVVTAYPYCHRLKYAALPFMALLGAVATVGVLLLDFVNAISLGKLAKLCFTPEKFVEQTGDTVSETAGPHSTSSMTDGLGGAGKTRSLEQGDDVLSNFDGASLDAFDGLSECSDRNYDDTPIHRGNGRRVTFNLSAVD